MRLIFTDLDATLLNHENYSFDEAKELLDELNDRKIPVIINTSKTYSEVVKLQSELNIHAPFVVENGGAIYFPTDQGFDEIILGVSAEEIKSKIAKYRDEIDIELLSELTIDQIVKRTNLSADQASEAQKRSFSQPFLLNSGDVEKFAQTIKDDGVELIRGGRFFHLISADQSKGKAMQMIIDHYKKSHSEVWTIALGDSANDLSMLRIADQAVLIKRPDGTHLSVDFAVYKSPFVAPKGWNEAVRRFL
jgi:mannosyl-3-phosphoglycerate phosphatase